MSVRFSPPVPELLEVVGSHPALPLFDLAAERYPDERRNVDSARSENFHAGRFMACDHATYSPAPATMESSGRRSRANGRAYGGATRYPVQRLLA